MRMKSLLISILVLLSVLLAACAGQPTQAGETPVSGTQSSETQAPDLQGPVNTAVSSTEVQGAADAAGTAGVVAVQDYNSLIDALQVAGTTVESGDPVNQPFFTVPGQILRVNGQDVQVFVYETAEAMEAEAGQVAADGSSIGGSMPSWVDTPHFYKAGRMLVLYVGQDQKIMDILSNILGSQFAGQ